MGVLLVFLVSGGIPLGTASLPANSPSIRVFQFLPVDRHLPFCKNGFNQARHKLPVLGKFDVRHQEVFFLILRAPSRPLTVE